MRKKTDLLWPVWRLPTVSTISAPLAFLIASSVIQLVISISSMTRLY